MGVSMAQFFFVFVLMIIPTMAYATSRSHSLEVQNLLKRLNKPHVKSIKSPDGDIIDCVLIHNQPAFDHPLLKNHTIQMRPSSFPKEDTIFPRESKEGSFKQVWNSKESCPEGTIPIKRVTEEDVLRASSVRRFGMKEPRIFPESSSPGVVGKSPYLGYSHEYGEVYLPNGEYYGTKVTMNVWTPRVQEPNEHSASLFWITAGPRDKVNVIEAGWHVHPSLHKDNKTRLFIYWTSDGYHKKGCYNLQCSGFVQVDKEITLGSFISPISTYGGSQFDITLEAWKDPDTGNWWLRVGDKLIGYWPWVLFNYMKKSASKIYWGGDIVNLKVGGKHTTTEMGSGHFAGEGYGKASFFRNLAIVDETNTLTLPEEIIDPKFNASCYNIILDDQTLKPEWGIYFYYGGPGRNPNCA
ncbi:uncharacterized protein LOC120014109 [Tripterygium wilfordii]|uniref:uncharacterized protein LOC120014109 n=1 Tax=Tripterygium wilfordii TaxID=458696 RepID=UPI0018F7EF9D|nr:uncharacterized protein LOC120014109 [Tripterygium wilfordii]